MCCFICIHVVSVVTDLLDRYLVHSFQKLVVCSYDLDVSQQAYAASVRCHLDLPVSIHVARYLLYINGPGLKTITDFSFPKGLKHAYIWKLVRQRLVAGLEFMHG